MLFLAFQTRLLEIFISADKSYVTYPYLIKLPNRYRFDGKLFNLRSLQAGSEPHADMILYADGMAEDVSTERKM